VASKIEKYLSVFELFAKRRLSEKTDKYRKKIRIPDGEMYLTICLEWAEDHIGFGFVVN